MKYRRYVSVIGSVLSIFLVIGCARADTQAPAERKHVRAERITRRGCPNLHHVDAALYRGAQPTVTGFKELKKLGIKTIVNLRASDTDRAGIEATKLDYVLLPVRHYNAKEEEIVRFLKIVIDGKRTPVFVHCRSGANRTGMMVAIYRVVVNDWSIADALREMRKGGYGSYGGGRAFDEYMKKLDVKELRKQAGLAEQQVESKK